MGPGPIFECNRHILVYLLCNKKTKKKKKKKKKKKIKKTSPVLKLWDLSKQTCPYFSKMINDGDEPT